MTAYERALLEQIAYLTDELQRIRDEREAARLAAEGAVPTTPIGWALRDPQFQAWLLRRQLANVPPGVTSRPVRGDGRESGGNIR